MKKIYVDSIAERLGVRDWQVENCVKLFEEGATIPFISRYRKERTGGLDDVAVAEVRHWHDVFVDMDKRKETVLETIGQAGALTADLRAKIENCVDARELEDLYLPYRPKRRTRATAAKEAGLEPLADRMYNVTLADPADFARKFVSDKVASVEDALAGARDIIAEWISQDEQARNGIRREFTYSAILTTKVVKGKESEEDAQKYRDYFAVKEPLRRITSHRLLAIRRAEAEGFIRVDISPDSEKALDKLARLFLKTNSDTTYQVELAMEDSYKRLLKPSIETEFAAMSKERADEEAIRVFAQNLRQLLLESPLGQKRVLALDPGFRTGCKTVVLSAQGDLLHHTVVFVNNIASTKTLQQLIAQYQIEAIAIGNGTASRECEQMVQHAIKNFELGIKNCDEESKFKIQNSKLHSKGFKGNRGNRGDREKSVDD